MTGAALALQAIAQSLVFHRSLSDSVADPVADPVPEPVPEPVQIKYWIRDQTWERSRFHIHFFTEVDMLPVQRTTFVIINPSESAESANLAFGIPHGSAASAGSRSAPPHSAGIQDGHGTTSGAHTGPATHALNRATLQMRLPPVRRRTAVAASLIAAGGISGATSLAILTHTLVSNAIGRRRSSPDPILSQVSQPSESTALFGQILSAMATAGLAIGCIGAGATLLSRRTANAPADGEGAAFHRHSRRIPRVPVALHEIVVEPNLVGAAATGSQEAASNPPTPRWDAAAAAAQLPFHDDHD